MKIEYRRTLEQNQLRVTQLEQMGETYEGKMFEYGTFHHLLGAVGGVENGVSYYAYSILGLQSLKQYVTYEAITAELLCSLFRSLRKAREEASRYLLRNQGLWLSLETIFYNLRTREFLFLYLPGYEQTCEEEVKKMMEELLPLLPHEDKEATSLGYGLYELAAQENLDFAELEKITEQKRLEVVEEVLEKEEPEPSVELEEEVPVKQEVIKEKIELFLKEHVKCHFDMGDLFSKRERQKKKQEKEKTFYCVPEEQLEETVYKTVLLSSVEQQEAKLIYKGSHGEKDFLIQGKEFFVGTNEERAQGVVKSQEVSRVHGRILQKEDGYYIEDLNSTNGTFVNGVLLATEEQRLLKPGDLVAFGREEYLFSH